MGILGHLNKSFLWEMNPIGQLIGWINTVWFSWHVSFSMYYEAPAGREGCVCERERVGWREGLKHPKECDDYLNSPVYCKGNLGIQSGTVQSWSFTFQKYSDPEEGGVGGGGENPALLSDDIHTYIIWCFDFESPFEYQSSKYNSRKQWFLLQITGIFTLHTE